MQDDEQKPEGADERPQDDEAAASRRWRALWRTHFYAGMFAMPFILLMSLTGLVILYTQPIQDATQGVRTVSDTGEWVSFDTQAQAVGEAFPDAAITSMIVPPDSTHATIFSLDDGSTAGRDVFVNPYTADVLGDAKTGGGIVGLANRLHGQLNNDSITVKLPTVSALWDDDAVMRDYVVGDLLLEMLGVWVVVLLATGWYLWFPRRSRNGGTERNGRRFLSLRLQKKGRARWRSLHAWSGILVTVMLGITLVSGLAWSTYWGPNFTALANEISPNSWTDAPESPLGQRGDIDRLGNQIPWNTGDRPIPASYAPASADLPAPLSLDAVVRIGNDEAMLPGFSVIFPANDVDEAGNAVYGSFTLSNSWPRKTGEGRDLHLDQFTGATLAEQNGWGYGSVSYAMDTLVSTHMGTQLGIFSRILMTLVCVLSIWSVFSGFVMFWKRRRPGTLGLPRRPADLRLGRRLTAFAIGFGVVFPQWALSALVVFGLDRFVIRRVRPLRVAFGQR